MAEFTPDVEADERRDFKRAIMDPAWMAGVQELDETDSDHRARAVHMIAQTIVAGAIQDTVENLEARHASVVKDLQDKVEHAVQAIDDSDQLRIEETRAKERFKTAADSWRADFMKRNAEAVTAVRAVESLGRMVTAILSTFQHAGHPGYAARQSGWISETHLAEWREQLAATLDEVAQAKNATSAVPTEPLSPAPDYLGRQATVDGLQAVLDELKAFREEWRNDRAAEVTYAALETGGCCPQYDPATGVHTPADLDPVPAPSELAQLIATGKPLVADTLQDCSSCGATNEECLESITRSKAARSCCGTCKMTNTHPPKVVKP